MDKATPVPGISLRYGGDAYQWLSADDLLVFHRADGLQWSVYRRDIQTGMETPMPPLDLLLRQTGGSPYSIRISPDHNQLLWSGVGKRIYEATLTGAGLEQWAYGPDETGASYWLGDSRRFVRYVKDRFSDPRPIVVRDVASPQHVRRVPLHWSQDEVTRENLTALLAAQRLPTRVYAEGGSRGTDQRDAFINVSLLGPAGVQEQTADVPLPPNFFRNERSDPYDLSDGRQLIWTLGARNVSHQPGWVQRLLARLGGYPTPTSTFGLYVSQADGLRWRFVGDWVEPSYLPYYEQEGETAPGSFRWVPGGRRISFEYRGRLYVTPTD